MSRVVITGMSVLAPNGSSVTEFHTSLCSGRPSIRPFITPFPEIRSRVAGTVTNLEDICGELSERESAHQDRYAMLALIAARRALRDAGLITTDGHPLADVCPSDVGVAYATAIGGTPAMEEIFADLTRRGEVDLPLDQPNDLLYEASMFNSVATRIGKMINAQNACITISTGCTAGIDAIGFAFESISAGDARLMVAGASEAPLTGITFASFDVIGALATSYNDTPEKASRPFDAKRDGFVLGEGAAFFILEELNHARKRGATILAEILDFSSGNNGFHMTDLPPDGSALASVISNGLKRTHVAAHEVGYINAHGSATPQNDVFETNAFKMAFGDSAYHIPVSSSKSMIGHALAAASAIGTVAGITAMQQQMLPPTINLEAPDERCDLDYIPNQARPSTPSHVLVTASGFSGVHSALLMKRLPREESLWKDALS